MQRAVVRRDVIGEHILVAVGLGQLLRGRTSTATRRLLLLPPLATRAFVFSFQRILVIEPLRRMLPVTIFELPLEPRILDLQLGNRLFQPPHAHDEIIDAQPVAVTRACRGF